MKSEYVRDYIKSVLDVCLTDYFKPGDGNGGWIIGIGEMEDVPREVKRLIEEVSVVEIWEGGRLCKYYQVRIISKTAALAMAAKYTLTSSTMVIPTEKMPWDKLAKELEGQMADPIGRQLSEMTAQLNTKNGNGDGLHAAEGPAQAG